MNNNYHSKKREASFKRHHEAIMHAAMEVFSAQGYHGARLDDIAVRAGLSKGTIYCHFKDKQDLFMSILDIEEQELQHQLWRIRTEYADARDVIEQSMRVYFSFYEKRAAVFRILFQEKHNFDKMARSKHIRVIHNRLHEFEAIISKGIQDGVIRKIDPWLGAVMITGIVNGLLYNRVLSETELGATDLFDTAIDLVKHGMYRNTADSGGAIKPNGQPLCHTSAGKDPS